MLTRQLAMAEMHDHVAPSKKKPVSSEASAGARAVEQSGFEGAPEFVSRTSLTQLQRRAGNQAVVGLVARTSIQRAPPTAAPSGATTIADLDKELDAFITSKDKVVEIIGKLSAPDKQTLLAGYKGKLAHALDFAHMKQATASLGASLPVRLDWLQAAAFITSGISY